MLLVVVLLIGGFLQAAHVEVQSKSLAEMFDFTLERVKTTASDGNFTLTVTITDNKTGEQLSEELSFSRYTWREHGQLFYDYCKASTTLLIKGNVKSELYKFLLAAQNKYCCTAEKSYTSPIYCNRADLSDPSDESASGWCSIQ